jgi:hypothetical protein
MTTQRWQVVAGQSGSSQKAHTSIAAPHLKHFFVWAI